MKVETIPWLIPNFVSIKMPPTTRQDGPNFNSSGFPLNEVDSETLSEMCDQFRAEVFKKAGRPDPKKGG